MKAAQLRAYGDVDQFQYGDAPDPVAGGGEVLIKIEASSLNPVDLYIRQGYLAQYYPFVFPAVLGIDAAGTVAALGSGVAGFAVGDRVIGKLPINGKGAQAGFAVANPAALARLPGNVDFKAGATLPLAGLTGRQAVDALGVTAGDRVLVTGALGAVGRSAVQYLKELGAVPVAAVRPARLAEAKRLTGDAVSLEAVDGESKFAAAVDSIGGAAAQFAISLVRDGGAVASVAQVPKGANADGRVRLINVMTVDNTAMLQQVADAAGRGELVIPIARSFPLAEIADAYRLLAGGQVGGKIVLTP